MSIGQWRQRLFHPRAATFNRWLAAVRWCLIILVGLVPLLFLPQTSYPMELNKTLLFVVAVLFVAALYVSGMVRSRQPAWLQTRLWWPIGIWLVLVLISFIFSPNYYVSAVGLNGYFSNGLIVTLCFVVFFYLIIHSIRSSGDATKLFVALTVSLSAAALYNLFHIFGYHIPLGSIWEQIRFYLVSNSSASLAVVVGIGAVASLGWLVISQRLWQRVLAGLLALAGLGLLFFLDKNPAWYAMLITGAFMIGACLARWRMVAARIMATLVLFSALALLGAVLDGDVLPDPEVSTSVLLDQATSLEIAGNSLLSKPLTGYGPQSFIYAFQAERPVSFNTTDMWRSTFQKSGSVWLEYIATIGPVATLALLVFMLWVGYAAVRTIIQSPTTDRAWYTQLFVFSLWLIIFVASWLLPFTFILHFLWWLLTALVARMLTPFIRVRFQKWSASKWCRWATVGGAAVMVLATLGAGYFGIRIWLADHAFWQAEQHIQKQAAITTIADDLQQAISLNPYPPAYYITLSQGYATAAQLAALDETTSAETLQQYSQQAVDAMKQAKHYAPQQANVYQQEAVLYDSLRNLIANVDELSAAAYDQAVTLSPYDPLLRLNLGRSQLLWAESVMHTDIDLAEQLIQQAIVHFDTARRLKPDFTLALINKALAYELAGVGEQALQVYLDVVAAVPTDDEVWFRIAQLYQQLDRDDEALAVLIQLQERNPENESIKQAIQGLKNENQTAE